LPQAEEKNETMMQNQPMSGRTDIALPKRVYLAIVHQAIRAFMAVYALCVFLATLIGRVFVRRQTHGPFDILLTGTFYSDNWRSAHLTPLALSNQCARLWVVPDSPMPPMEKVEAVYPPRWLVRTLGRVPARLLTFFWVGVRRRPHWIGGFHLMFNGMSAVLLARMLGARAIYFCVGGPQELIGGGYATENRFFARLETPDPVVERQLLNTVGKFDMVVTMGKKAIQYFEQRGIRTFFCTVSGGIDGRRFFPASNIPEYDMILVARLTPVKRVERFLEAIALTRKTLPEVSAVVVGDGPLFDSLREHASHLGLDANVTFAGHQNRVEDWLRKSRIFVLTSETEGLALSMMEAMMCGVPAIVPDVGDLGELLEDGVNGYLIQSSAPEDFARRMTEVLSKLERWKSLSHGALQAASRYELNATIRLWDTLLARPID